jgi:uncharacterized membrane protein
MALLIAATALVIASHVVPSAPGLRERLIRSLGRPGFYAGHSLISLLALGLLVWAYWSAGPQDWLYEPIGAARIIGLAAMAVATLLVTARLTTRPAPDRPRGIYRATGVPGSLGVLLWALVHLLNLGEARAVVVFGGLAIMTLIALVKNLAVAGAADRNVGWPPFAAILGGREILVWREIGWWRLALGLLAYAGPVVIGRDPLAGVWQANAATAGFHGGRTASSEPIRETARLPIDAGQSALEHAAA